MQYADTPHFDYLARNGRNGRLKTVPDGFHPGSEVANSSILGYDQRVVYEGRGPLEAASIGVDLAEDDLALRCNLISIDGEVLKSHSCGRLETEEGDVLIKFLEEKLGSERVHFYTGVQYRHLLVVKGGHKNLLCTPPHDIPGKPFGTYMLREGCPEAHETAELLRDLVIRSQALLKDHPLNLQRMKEGKEPANSIWPWGGGYRPAMAPLASRFPDIQRGAVITAVDLIRGIGRYAGLRVIDVEGATGLYDTNYEGKAQAALEALKTDDFVYLHLEASDEAGHDGNLALKLKTVRDIDNRLLAPILEQMNGFEEPLCVALLPDHPTPVKLRTHTADPIPFCIYYPGIEPDEVQTFDEEACKNGSYGLLYEDDFIVELMKNE